MAPRKEVQSLLDLSFKSVKDYLVMVCNNLLSSDSLAPKEYLKLIEQLRGYLYESTAITLHNRIGNMCLRVLDSFFQGVDDNEPSLSAKAQIITEQLSAIIANPRLESIDGELCEPVAATLLQALHELRGIKKLNCSSFKKALITTDCKDLLEKRILSSCNAFLNLNHFEATQSTPCSNAVIKALCKNCPELETIIVRCHDVTDECIESLIECKKLAVADLLGSGVTSYGLYHLLAESKSETLDVEFGRRAEEIFSLLNNRENNMSRSFGKKHLKLESEDNVKLKMVTKFFPQLACLELDSENVPNLSSLVNLKDLTALGLRVDKIATSQHHLSSFFQIAGSNITVLALIGFEDSLSPNVLFNICLQCPNVRELEVGMGEQGDFVFPTSVRLGAREPFQRLETLKVSWDSLNFAKEVVRHAPNIKKLCLEEYKTSSEEFFEYVFQSNPLKYVEHILLTPCQDILAVTFRSMIEKCERLKRVVYIHGDIKPDKALILSIQQFIKTNNYKVDFQPVQEWIRLSENYHNIFEILYRPVKLDSDIDSKSI